MLLIKTKDLSMNGLFTKCELNINRFNASVKEEGQYIVDEMSRVMIEQTERGYKKIGFPSPNVHPTIIKFVVGYFRHEGFKCDYKKDHFMLSIPNMRR